MPVRENIKWTETLPSADLEVLQDRLLDAIAQVMNFVCVEYPVGMLCEYRPNEPGPQRIGRIHAHEPHMIHVRDVEDDSIHIIGYYDVRRMDIGDVIVPEAQEQISIPLERLLPAD